MQHFRNQQVVGVMDAHVMQLQHRLRGDGRWRILIFPGDIRLESSLNALLKLAEQLESL